MKLRARSTVLWTGITKDIDNTVSHCSQCQESQPQLRREPMTPSEMPPRAWHTIGADLVMLNGEYLVVADYYSKYPFVFKLSSTESYSIIEKLKNLFSEQGIPAIPRTDNGPQFVSYKFKKFAEEFGFQHHFVTVSSARKRLHRESSEDREASTLKSPEKQPRSSHGTCFFESNAD